MRKLIYTLLFTLTTQAQNMVIDCVKTIKTEQFITVSDTLKGYSGLIMLQSKSGLKINNIDGDVTFIHGLLAREELSDYIKPKLIINKCNATVNVSDRIDLQVLDKYCRIQRFTQ